MRQLRSGLHNPDGDIHHAVAIPSHAACCERPFRAYSKPQHPGGTGTHLARRTPELTGFSGVLGGPFWRLDPCFRKDLHLFGT